MGTAQADQGERQIADTIRLVDYFYIEASDRPGEGARAPSMLKDAGVHLLAFHGFPKGRRAQLDFVPSDPAAFKAAARNARWKITGPKKVFVIEGEDRTGALVDYFSRLAQEKVNVTATDAIAAGAWYYDGLVFKDVVRNVGET